jgi:hypothetical protein
LALAPVAAIVHTSLAERAASPSFVPRALTVLLVNALRSHPLP